MRKVTDKEVNAVIRLDGPARVERFVKVVADDEVAWGLWADGWALMADDEGRQVFPLWPARQYAELCRTDEWSAYEAREIELSVLLEEFFPKFREQGVLAGVFPTPGGKGVGVSAEDLESLLREELKKYEKEVRCGRDRGRRDPWWRLVVAANRRWGLSGVLCK